MEDSELQTLALSPTTPTLPENYSAVSLIHQPSKIKSWRKNHPTSNAKTEGFHASNKGQKTDKITPEKKNSDKLAASKMKGPSLHSPNPRKTMPSKHQVLVQSNSVEATPKRKTERLSSAPGCTVPTSVASDLSSGWGGQISSQHIRSDNELAGKDQKYNIAGAHASISGSSNVENDQHPPVTSTQESRYTEPPVQSPFTPLPTHSPQTDRIELGWLREESSRISSDRPGPPPPNAQKFSSSEKQEEVTEATSLLSYKSHSPAPVSTDNFLSDFMSNDADNDLLPAVTVHDTSNSSMNINPIKLHSLQSNITLNIKPEAIRGTSNKGPHTVISIDSNDYYEKKRDVAQNYRYSDVSSRVGHAVVDNQDKEINRSVTPKSSGENNKPTSFLTRLLSHSSDHSSKNSSDTFKLFSDNQSKKEKRSEHFGSTVALAGSNNSDSGSASLSDSSNLMKKSTRRSFRNSSSRLFQFAFGRSSPSKSSRVSSPRDSLDANIGFRKNGSPVRFNDDDCIYEDGDEYLTSPNLPNLPSVGAVDSIADLDSVDDDEAWFDSVTKLSEMWFKGYTTGVDDNPHENFMTPVGKSGVGNLVHQRVEGLRQNYSYPSLPSGKSQSGYSALSSFQQNIFTPDSNLDKNKKYCASICSTTSNVNSSQVGKNNVTSLHKMLHGRGLYRPRLLIKPPPVPTPNIDDAGAVREIEAGLLHLMEEFEAGNLTAFGRDSRLRQMEMIREQQESLSRLHQDVGARQDLFQPLSTEGIQNSAEHMTTLMEKLTSLSQAIDKLQDNTTDRKLSDNSADKKSSVNEVPAVKLENSIEVAVKDSVDNEKTVENLVPDVENSETGVIVRSKTSNKLAPRKAPNRKSADFSLEGKAFNGTVAGKRCGIVETSADNYRDGNIISNIDHSLPVHDTKGGLTVLPLKNTATDGLRTFIIDAHGQPEPFFGDTRDAKPEGHSEKSATKSARLRHQNSREEKLKLKRASKDVNSDLEARFDEIESRQRPSKNTRDGRRAPFEGSLPKCHMETEGNVGNTTAKKPRKPDISALPATHIKFSEQPPALPARPAPPAFRHQPTPAP